MLSFMDKDEYPHINTPEAELFRAVIRQVLHDAQAIHDGVGIGKELDYVDKKYLMNQIRNMSFKEICHNAGVWYYSLLDTVRAIYAGKLRYRIRGPKREVHH